MAYLSCSVSHALHSDQLSDLPSVAPYWPVVTVHISCGMSDTNTKVNTKVKKPLTMRESAKRGRRKSSVSKVEDVVSRYMECQDGSGFAFPDIEKDKIKEAEANKNQDDKLVRRFVLYES